MSLHLRSEYVSFREIPETTQLYLDYLDRTDTVRSFYADVDRDPAALAQFARVIGEQDYPRDILADVLLDQNERFASGPETMRLIEQLRESQTVAVVTGQQAGLFTGPMYTILKALTTVLISRDLQAHGVAAVPVFWIESDDHDQEEVDHCYLINPEGRARRITYPIEPSESGKAVGQLVLTEAVHGVIDEAVALLPPSEFMPGIEGEVREAYQPGLGMADGFARLMARWFDGIGLILLDPTDIRLKRTLTGMFERVIRGTTEVAQLLRDQTDRLLQAGFQPQLHVADGMVPLFMTQGNRRIGLTHKGGRFALKSGDGAYEVRELLEIARSHPDQLSPGVALRPVAQDHLLPTLAYIGGPSEVAYWSQIKPLFQWFGRAVTPIIPRASATLIERRHAKTFDKYDLRFVEVFKGVDHLLRRAVEAGVARQTAELFDVTQESFEAQLEQIHRSLVSIDPTLGRATRTAREKVLYQLNQLRGRFTQAQAKKEELTVQHIERLFHTLYPSGTLQERRLNVLHFLSRYSPELLSKLLGTLDAWRPDHQVIFIG